MSQSVFTKLKQQEKKEEEKQLGSHPVQPKVRSKLSNKVSDNLDTLKNAIGNPEDLNLRYISIGKLQKKCGIAYLSGITDTNMINQDIIQTLQQNLKEMEGSPLENVKLEMIAVSSVAELNDMKEIINLVLDGQTVFFLEEEENALVIGTSGGDKRAIEQPQSENLIQGPREGFVESLEVNLAMIRRNLRDPNLRFKAYEVGTRSKQKLVLCYVEDVINPQILEEVIYRLESIELEYITDVSQIEQWIEDSSLSPFPQMLSTERPDKVAFEVLHGRFAVLVDGTPFSAIGPVVLSDINKSMEDYNQRWITASLLRILRVVASLIALFLPAFYIAMVLFHPGMLPTTLVFSIAASREGMPFSAIAEILLMAATFEMLQEAAIRLPRIIGQTIGIVGGIVIGEAAVSAGIASPIIVIITALTAIASFCSPYYSVAISFRAVRFGFMLICALFGLFGLILAFLVLVIHVTNLKSFGVPYSFTVFPAVKQDMMDNVIRGPITKVEEQYIFLQDELKDPNRQRNE
ncbi:spore germination protein [Oceanobacillus sojae]|uniref:Spore germination protein n=1 Tax=Oceanobacillus sojae TaxID=582851 RepID=A0A511ZPF5_9BACI|nr:spore germination protein [Oceanobacillus sojae]GEN89279.1 spore germination protein [Oceanobacillus sojae]